MILNIIFAIILGLIYGIIVNMLSDELPYRRDPGIPVYANGTPRPFAAWSGIVAFLLGKRFPPEDATPNKERARTHHRSEGLTWRYPLTEIATMILVFFALERMGVRPDANSIQTFLHTIYMAICVLIIVIDVEHRLILFVTMIPAIAIALLDALLLPIPGPDIQSALLGAGAGFLTFYVIYQGGFLFTWIIGKLRNRNITTVAFGFGDVMMITLTGAWVGFPFIVTAITFTIIFGAIGAVVYLVGQRLLRGGYRAYSPIPYGPYIVIATIIMLLYGQEAWQFVLS